jgi:hypothetical protein
MKLGGRFAENASIASLWSSVRLDSAS